METAAKQRDDIIVSFLMILKKARQHNIGPSLRAVVHAPQTDVCKYLGYRSVCLADFTRLPSNRETELSVIDSVQI